MVIAPNIAGGEHIFYVRCDHYTLAFPVYHLLKVLFDFWRQRGGSNGPGRRGIIYLNCGDNGVLLGDSFRPWPLCVVSDEYLLALAASNSGTDFSSAGADFSGLSGQGKGGFDIITR